MSTSRRPQSPARTGSPYAIPSAKALNAAAELRSTLVRDLLLVVGLLALVALAASVALSRQFVSPILHLAGVMERVRAGRLDARATVQSNDELGAGPRREPDADSLVSLVQTRAERDELQSEHPPPAREVERRGRRPALWRPRWPA